MRGLERSGEKPQQCLCHQGPVQIQARGPQMRKHCQQLNRRTEIAPQPGRRRLLVEVPSQSFQMDSGPVRAGMRPVSTGRAQGRCCGRFVRERHDARRAILHLPLPDSVSCAAGHGSL